MADGRAREQRRVGVFGAVWASIAIFLVVLAVLAARLAAGQDPALLARKLNTPPPPRRVLVRRVYEKVVVVHLLPARAAPSGAGSPQHVSSEGASAGPSQQVSPESAPEAPSAPAPEAPSAVVTRTS